MELKLINRSQVNDISKTQNSEIINNLTKNNILDYDVINIFDLK